MVFNPKWLQIVLYMVVTLLFCLTMFLFYWATIIIIEEGMVGSVPILFFGATFGYVSYITSTLVKYIPAKLTYHEKGFSVELKGNTYQYSWTDISTTKIHGVSRVFQLFDRNAKIFYVVCFFTPGYKKFENRVNHRTNLTESE
jgi:hypothetical protein